MVGPSRRKPLSKKVRFEVFKRDSFTCQYCGQNAPDVVLECDHITPVAEGGDNDLMNLITSCKDCNRGKAARRLDDDTVVAKRHAQAKEVQERREQIQMMADWHKALVGHGQEEAQAVSDLLSELSGGVWSLNENGMKTAKGWVRRFGLDETMESCRIAADTYFRHEDGAVTGESFEHALGKIGGICYNRKRWRENPEEADEAKEAWEFVRAYRQWSQHPANWKLFNWWKDARGMCDISPEQAAESIRAEYASGGYSSYWSAADVVLERIEEAS